MAEEVLGKGAAHVKDVYLCLRKRERRQKAPLYAVIPPVSLEVVLNVYEIGPFDVLNQAQDSLFRTLEHPGKICK